MRTQIDRPALMTLLVDAVEADGHFPKDYSIEIAVTSPQLEDFNWIAIFSTESTACPGYEDRFGALAAALAERHNLVSC